MTDEHVRSALPRYGRVPRGLLRDPNLSDRAVRLYGLLDDYAGPEGRAWPKRATLAESLACSLDSLDRAIRELVAGQWLIRERQRRDDGGSTSNLYTLTAGPLADRAAGVRPPDRTDAAAPAAPVRHQEGDPREGTTPQPPKGGARDRREASDGDPAWEAFWSAYPRKTGKGAARRAFPAALDKVDNVDTLIAAAKAYGRVITELRYACHPATWLRGERWLDDLSGISGAVQGTHTADPNRKVNWRKGMPECPIHSGYHRDGCVACASEAKAVD